MICGDDRDYTQFPVLINSLMLSQIKESMTVIVPPIIDLSAPSNDLKPSVTIFELRLTMQSQLVTPALLCLK